MKQIITTVFLLFLATSAFAATSIVVEYRKPADIFEIMDNVSNWYPGFNDEAYQEYWIKKYGISDKDKDLFSQYKAFREHYYNDPDQKEKDPLKNRNGFFSTYGSVNSDPVAKAFYASKTMENAYERLKSIITSEEILFLNKFFSHFEPKFKIFTDESKSFDSIVKKTRADVQAKGLNKYFRDILRFYGVKSEIKYDVLFVWWPPIGRTNASPSGNYLIMRYNPIKHSTQDDTDIVMHEVMHTISAQMSVENKTKMTKQFIEICDVRDSLKKLKILEEPLAVANGQMLYQDRFQPKRFQHADKWYTDVWVNAFAKLIYPTVKTYVEHGRQMDSEFIQKVAGMCKEVSLAANVIKKNKTP